MKVRVVLFSIIILFVAGPTANGQILDGQKMLDKFDFWHNKDWTWYKENIPFLETPDSDIDLTWYYRWEVITDHTVYGSPKDGYSFTEFIDRPWWSGTYGAISCAAGHQLYELRWFRDPKFAHDYAEYFFNVPGAQPRNYSTWIADGVWQIYKTYYDSKFAKALLPHLEENYKGWEKEHYVPAEGMFAWDGMHDGMETNINSRQTKNWFAGAPGYRPTLNSYMWADANAIADISALSGDTKTRDLYVRKADTIKQNFQKKLWDPKRDFFFHRFQNDEEGGIKANTLTYETGKYAGSEHGREEIGFVPWYFNMPDEGYEGAWKFLMDSAYFFSKFGPTTVERNDPLFNVAKNCCAWSGNAWPYATSQTLKGMANLVKNYQKSPITKDDYFTQLKIFALTHRKGDAPYIAEANNPFTGSWSGHDHENHSEHYFHSSYIDLVITGLIGLEPMASDSVEINPLIPAEWNYFALDKVAYHGHNLSVVWDKTGEKYHKGKGLTVWIDGKMIGSSPDIKKMVLPVKPAVTVTPKLMYNLAVNNSTEKYYPRAFASFPGIGSDTYLKLNDGQFFYYRSPANHWTTQGRKSSTAFAGIDFGSEQSINEVKVYFIDDAEGSIKKPKSFRVEYWKDGRWQTVTEVSRNPAKPSGGRSNTVIIRPINTSKIRIQLTLQKGSDAGISEIETWSNGIGAAMPQEADVKNAAYFKHATFKYSYTSRFDEIKGINDGLANPTLRWTAFESPNAKDWVSFDFDKPKKVSTVYLYFFDDKGGVQPPSEYQVEYWDGKQWNAVKDAKPLPVKPIANLNLVSFQPINTTGIRIVLTHKSNKIFSGLYEVEIY